VKIVVDALHPVADGAVRNGHHELMRDGLVATDLHEAYDIEEGHCTGKPRVHTKRCGHNTGEIIQLLFTSQRVKYEESW